jgi:hypothetical protein
MHHGAENNRGYHHFYKLDKGIAKWLKGFANLRKKCPYTYAQSNTDQYLYVKNAVPGFA